MKPLLALSLVLFLAGTGTAAAQDVRYNFDKEANFGSFKTYKWVVIKGATQLSDLAELSRQQALMLDHAADAVTLSGWELASSNPLAK